MRAGLPSPSARQKGDFNGLPSSGQPRALETALPPDHEDKGPGECHQGSGQPMAERPLSEGQVPEYHSHNRPGALDAQHVGGQLKGERLHLQNEHASEKQTVQEESAAAGGREPESEASLPVLRLAATVPIPGGYQGEGQEQNGRVPPDNMNP